VVALSLLAEVSPSAMPTLAFLTAVPVGGACYRIPPASTPLRRSIAAKSVSLAGTHGALVPRACAVSPSASPHVPLTGSDDRAARLPWEKSIAGDDIELLFMPFLEHQLKVMRHEFAAEGLGEKLFETDLSYQSSDRRPARIESWQWKSDHFRKIRATYIDCGVAAQVFNSVWYPDPKYDLPLLGIDFLSFGKKKVLCVLDFQPLVQDPAYLEKYCEPISYIKAKYEGLAGEMSSRFYDETLFFSKQLAFAKFDNATPVATQLFPAFKEYLCGYVAMIKAAQPNTDRTVVARVSKLQDDYDQYSAERDPAVGLFSTYWGEEWAEMFTHEFLFSAAIPLTPEQKKVAKAAKAAQMAAQAAASSSPAAGPTQPS
jgi:15,16-dihydrobiliverdin:ferredoxin oxidoreductase